jgi:excisionase family DNA binding protein
MMMTWSESLVTTGFIAKHCGAQPITVARWIKSGKLKAVRTPGGRFRVTRQDFHRFLVAHGFPVDENLLPDTRVRILVVDDDEAVIRMLIRGLGDFPLACEVQSAKDGYEAGMQVERFHPDLVILDIRMPGLSGFEVCRRIRKDPDQQHTRIIVLTGYLTPEAEIEAMASGADVCLGKPVNLQQLMEVAQRLVGGRQIV